MPDPALLTRFRSCEFDSHAIHPIFFWLHVGSKNHEHATLASTWQDALRAKSNMSLPRRANVRFEVVKALPSQSCLIIAQRGLGFPTSEFDQDSWSFFSTSCCLRLFCPSSTVVALMSVTAGYRGVRIEARSKLVPEG